jgi:hypothetical protein
VEAERHRLCLLSHIQLPHVLLRLHQGTSVPPFTQNPSLGPRAPWVSSIPVLHRKRGLPGALKGVAVVLLSSLIDGLGGGASRCWWGFVCMGRSASTGTAKPRGSTFGVAGTGSRAPACQPELQLPPPCELSTPGYLVKFHLKHAQNSMKGTCSMVALGLW